ncbi:hypothetical protein SLEP1_g28460 [Rubroshorea leprosula]|uniref:glucan endo-1,3-beta-D-glucosidase n=1 Tax=Rubroshorea leprosula TaxID=152421 RepID=A0AAV5K540_9ROSI|nr:hypothetical protein SLEP1_g28460 [Rubroshorea leprosula]
MKSSFPMDNKRSSAKPLLFCLIMSCLLVGSWAQISNKIGINYGRFGNNLPSPYRSIEIIKSMKAGRVKLYDSDHEVLKLLSGTKLEVSIMIPNSDIINLGLEQTSADQWVEDNVVPYYPATMIRFILVGNRVLSHYSDHDREIWRHLVPAMRRVKAALRARYMRNIKVSTSLAMDILQSTFPPSNGTFRSDVSANVVAPLMHFLNSTNSYLFLNVYPYFPWSTNPKDISLDSALFEGNVSYKDPGSGLVYNNLLDQMLDSINFAMEKLGYPNVPLVISETGWPNSGDLDQIGANVHNAATYNRNLIGRMTANPPLGTPARPGVVIPTFIYSLFDENQKAGIGTERHWGLLRQDGTSIYDIDLSGERQESDYRPLPVTQNNEPYRGKIWCVAAAEANLTELGSALNFACNQGNGTCAALAPSRECYQPVSLVRHASYAFSSYWVQFRSLGASCYFNGLAVQTTTDPGNLF